MALEIDTIQVLCLSRNRHGQSPELVFQTLGVEQIGHGGIIARLGNVLDTESPSRCHLKLTAFAWTSFRLSLNRGMRFAKDFSHFSYFDSAIGFYIWNGGSRSYFSGTMDSAQHDRNINST
jgi:hypothetical protein